MKAHQIKILEDVRYICFSTTKYSIVQETLLMSFLIVFMPGGIEGAWANDEMPDGVLAFEQFTSMSTKVEKKSCRKNKLHRADTEADGQE